ncbi:hypothetical protein D3C78_1269490 [compost metagenome]
MGQVALLARPPLGLALVEGIGAVEHHAQHAFAEVLVDLRGVLVAAVLDHVVQQGGDGLVLVAAVLQHQGADRQRVGDVGHCGALAQLAGVHVGGIAEGAGQPLAVLHRGRLPMLADGWLGGRRGGLGGGAEPLHGGDQCGNPAHVVISCRARLCLPDAATLCSFRRQVHPVEVHR